MDMCVVLDVVARYRRATKKAQASLRAVKISFRFHETTENNRKNLFLIERRRLAPRVHELDSQSCGLTRDLPSVWCRKIHYVSGYSASISHSCDDCHYFSLKQQRLDMNRK